MIKLHRKMSVLRSLGLLILTIVTVSQLAACSRNQPPSDLEVDKMPVGEMQATSFLLLNEDKPGTPVEVQRYLVPGKYTIVGYLSPYDENSTTIEPQLAKLTQIRNDISVRIVDINRPGVESIDWQSPIIQDLKIQKLPYFEIYDPEKSMRAHGRPAYEQVIQWLQTSPEGQN